MNEGMFQDLLVTLIDGQVDFLLIGGLAGIVHGASRATLDVDVVDSRHDENLTRLAKAMSPYQPYPRGAPAGLPFEFDVPTIRAGLNFTLSTDLGPIDLFGEVAGDGMYEKLLSEMDELELFGFPGALK